MHGIKFRGRNDHSWHFGLLTFMFGDYAISHVEDENTVDLIDKATVGQYTGFKDKNDVEIYVGDILGLMSTRALGYHAPGIIVKKVVSFGEFWTDDNTLCHYAGFYLGNSDLGESISYFVDRGAEVIGNIHDNPELIK